MHAIHEFQHHLSLMVMDILHHRLQSLAAFFGFAVRRLTGQPIEESADDQILWDDGEPEER
jgi:hypothetical protein